MPSYKDLTVIFVTYNSEKIIKESISGFLNYPDLSIIVVDNNSRDNTIREIESLKADNIKIIKNEKNVGFGRANNRALNAINTKYALIINPDCFIEKDSIDKILSKIDNHEDVAILSAQLYPTETIQDKISHRKNPSQDLLQDDIYDVRFISGCCMFFNMKIMKEIGFFDEEFFLYCEDNELCKRILNKGLRLGIVKDTKAIHRGGQSCGAVDEKKLYAIFWHRFGWSKCYYTEAVHCKLVGKLKAIRDILKCLFKILKAKITCKKPDLAVMAKLDGCFSYLIGKKAFDKNDNPRKFSSN